MRMGIGLAVLALSAGCTRPPALDIVPIPELPGDDPCGLWAIQRTLGGGFGPVRACAPPVEAEVSMACRVADSLSRNPDPRPDDPPSRGLEVRALACELTDAAHGNAACRFEGRWEGEEWRPMQARLTRTYWTHMDELVFERGISWRADETCG